MMGRSRANEKVACQLTHPCYASSIGTIHHPNFAEKAAAQTTTIPSNL
jgi:hypothetical protein